MIAEFVSLNYTLCHIIKKLEAYFFFEQTKNILVIKNNEKTTKYVYKKKKLQTKGSDQIADSLCL